MTDQTPAIVQTRREIRVVEDVIPILDTGRFEHIQRIAGAMAQSSLIPETLRGVRKDKTFEPFEHQTVVANLFRVVNQAVRWGMDPFAVVDHVSVVHGRLMYEGKLVHAVIEARIGLRLGYRFGRMIDGAFDASQEGKGEALAVQVFGTFDDEGEERTVEGLVSDWKTTGANSPWGKASNWKRQLRYRGAREWARAHAPGVMLGVMTDDEIDHDIDREERVSRSRRKVDIAGKLEGPKGGEGFSGEHVASETSGMGKGDVIEGDARPIETGSAPTAEPEPDTSASATDASDDTPEVTSGLTASDEATDQTGGETHGPDDADSLDNLRLTSYEDGYDGEPVEASLALCDTDEERAIVREEHARGLQAKMEKEAAEHAASEAVEGFDFDDVGGPAPKGVKYMLASDEPQDGRIQVYQDGKPFSTSGPKGVKGLKRYDAHPEPADPMLASQGGGKPARTGFMAEIAGAESWLVAKPKLSALYQTPDFKALSPDDQAQTRANIFEAVLEMKERTRDPVDWAVDPTAFALWMDHEALSGSPDAANAIQGTFDTLASGSAYGKMKPEQQSALASRVAAAISKLKGA